MWHEVCMEFRYRLEQSILIPGVNLGQPDTAQCLLYQKLQMVNCCINRKLAREAASNSVEVIEVDDEGEDEAEYVCLERMS